MLKENPFQKRNEIFREFYQGVFYEELYEKYKISEEELISILNDNIKGNYDYKIILSGGIKAQKQFIKHLKNRWNPLEPDAPWKEIPAYLPNEVKKTQKK